VDYGCRLQATLAINDTLTHWMVSEEPIPKPCPKASVVELPDFIVASACVDLLLVLLLMLRAESLAAVQQRRAHWRGARFLRCGAQSVHTLASVNVWQSIQNQNLIECVNVAVDVSGDDWPLV